MPLASRRSSDHGGKIMALAEYDGGLVDDTGHGLDIAGIKQYHARRGSITGFPRRQGR